MGKDATSDAKGDEALVERLEAAWERGEINDTATTIVNRNDLDKAITALRAKGEVPADVGLLKQQIQDARDSLNKAIEQLISMQVEALVTPDKHGGLVEAVEVVREELRVLMLKQPNSGMRETYSDGFANGLAYAIQSIDKALTRFHANTK